MKISNLDYSGLLQRYPVLIGCSKHIVEATNLIASSFKNGGKLIVMGNGGSSADAEHLCGELLKSFIKKRELTEEEKKLFQGIDTEIPLKIQGALPAISLGVQYSIISAFSNDIDSEYCFAQQVWGLGQKNDIVMGITTSGNSKNVVHAINVARAKGIKTIALTGEKESKLSPIVDVCVRAPGTITHHVQELHLPIYHSMCLELENIFFK
jgi:D-sedoheptulose 7-phosphate isomerase